ncbi:MAG: peptidase M23 [Flavobacterium sp. BFFFF1]|uniref:murein hydrolase activator EnvC family protein n=1 Tax=Flavobacterium sp. BFFFF1 TaxID=2015557 RepID=UPI000BCC6682|nr:peptidoglycan DD-metalloendopeptidase family protein [Flavobacterium sp. BFFFF1]OYU79331.1 MAG: peptidase M23 [Flavobacterium sp. BFFFF1]
MPKIIVALFFLFVSAVGWSQVDQEKLEQRKAQIQEEIREKERLLESQNQKQKSVTTIIAQQLEKIKLREKLINTTEKQAKLLKNNMYINQLEINKLNRELTDLKADYARMIVKSYKSRSEQSRAMFLLSSKNFLQAYKRAQYMKQYANYRRAQGEQIKKKQSELANYNGKLEVQKTEKQKLVEEQQKEREKLEQEKQEQEKLVNSIKKDKKKTIAEIKKKQQESRNIDRQIDKLIRAAIAEANKKTAAANLKANPKTTTAEETKKTETATKIVLTPEAKLVSDNFKANKGKLPWPVEKGTVSLRFGDQPHPLISSLTVHCSGVEITTDKEASARAVYSGTVYSIQRLSPVNMAVMIQHGDFFTVYQNLSSVSVNKGDKVSTKQNIGRVRTNTDTGKTVIKFMISQNTNYQNPASWLFNM